MFDVDDDRRGDRDTLPCYLDPKFLSLFEAVGKAAQFFDELVYRVVLLDIAFVFFPLLCHMYSLLILIWQFQAFPHGAYNVGFQPKIRIGKEDENVHEKKYELKFQFISFCPCGRALKHDSGYSIAPSQPLRMNHLTSSSTGVMEAATAKMITQSISGRL